jgi:hypothetical protein
MTSGIGAGLLIDATLDEAKSLAASQEFEFWLMFKL